LCCTTNITYTPTLVIAGLDATGILAPLGALVGLIGGIVGFFEGKKTEEETPPEIMTPIFNPSSQFI
jgi:hypothetical protein